MNLDLNPCSQTLIVNWVPTISYYENRLKPLTKLEEAGSLLQFKVDADLLGARLETCEIVISPSGLKLFAARNIAEGQSREILEAFLDSVKPRRYSNSGFLFQYVIPLEGESYDGARDSGLRAFRGADFPDVGAKDFALVLNGTGWSLEAGIVNKDEIVARVTRQVGGMSALGGSTVALEAAGRPDVAFFCDSYWPISQYPPDNGASEWFLDKVHEVVENAKAVVTKVYEGLTNRSPSDEERTSR